jgi:hypothetical protein
MSGRHITLFEQKKMFKGMKVPREDRLWSWKKPKAKHYVAMMKHK